MKINRMHIHGIGGIENIELQFDPHMNIICGPNGIGKTTILECIAHSFTYSTSGFLRKKADHECGYWNLYLNNGVELRIEKRNFHPNDEQSHRGNSNVGHVYVDDIISIKTYRTINYSKLDAIMSDPKSLQNNNVVIQGMQAHDVKNWFVNRHLWSAHQDSLSEAQLHNLDLAKRVFNMIDPSVTFSRVNGATNDIMVLQKDNTEIYFEYLSSGYSAVLYIILGLIKEIEFRFKNDNLICERFNGIVLIDEIDLHLHPQWQSNILSILKQVFPMVQFIVTTHSAHVIQNASVNEIIPLERNENGATVVRDIQSTRYGFQGWTVEEILIDVMGLNNTNSPFFLELVKKFEKGIDEENIGLATEAFNVLDDMLHPNNHLRKLLKLQLASLGSV